MKKSRTKLLEEKYNVYIKRVNVNGFFQYIWGRTEKCDELDWDDVDVLLTLDDVEESIVNTFDDLEIDQDFEILPQPKRVGDLKCGKDIKNCSKCPLRAICETIMFNSPIKLYDILKRYELNNSTKLDQEIYDILKARLDRVVFERHDNMEE